MKLVLKRKHFFANATIGELYRDGEFECFTLEDTVREPAERPQDLDQVAAWVTTWKVQNQTAIPKGTYKVVLDHSTRFNRTMPHVLEVPGFEGIRLHCGNTDKDTDGCVLLAAAYNPGEAVVWHSKIAWDALWPVMEQAEEITLEAQ